MGEAGRERIRTQLSLERMVATYIDHYRAVVDKVS